MSKSREEKSGVFSEQPNSKLEWMYKNSTELLNREEYLLGKSIDKNFEQLNEEERTNKQKSLVGVTVPKNHVEHECIPFSIRSYRSKHNDEQVDIQRKIVEDPLMAIRQKEMESRRKILENPVKLKELHRLLKEEESKKKIGSHSKKKKKKKDKKQRKSKKKRKKSDSDEGSSSSDGEDLDTLLARKYRQIQEELGPNDGTFSKLNLKKLLNSKDDKHTAGEVSDRRTAKKRKSSGSGDSEDEHRIRNNKYRDYESQRHTARSESSSYRNKSKNGSPKRHRDDMTAATSSKETTRSREKDYRTHSCDRNIHRRHDKRKESQNTSSKQKSLKTRSSSESLSSSSSEDSSEKPVRKTYGLVTAAGKKIKLKNSNLPKSSSASNYEKQKEKSKMPAHSAQPHRKKKLTDEEKQRRCREMVQNAAWRDTERKQKVDKYKEECEREKNETRDYDKSFINKEVHKAMQNQTSVESRLKANINNIQRSDRAMERNFARR